MSNDLSLLVDRFNCYSHVTAASRGILKKVISEVSFQTELQVLQALWPSVFVRMLPSLLRFNTEECYMFISLGVYVSPLVFSSGEAILGGMPEYLRMFKDLQGGLDHVHGLGLIHRGIRFENIIYCDSAKKIVLIGRQIDGHVALDGPLVHLVCRPRV